MGVFFNAHASSLEIEGVISNVDTRLSPVIGVGESIKFQIILDDESKNHDMWGSSTSVDGTSFYYRSATMLLQNGYQASSGSGRFIIHDNSVFLSPTNEGFGWESHSFSGPDVNNNQLSSVYFSLGFMRGTFHAEQKADPNDVLNLADISKILPVEFNGKHDAQFSFKDSTGHSLKVKFNTHTIRLKGNKKSYIQTLGMTDINNDTTADLALIYKRDKQLSGLEFRSTVNGEVISSLSFANNIVPVSISLSSDYNDDSVKELSVLVQNELTRENSLLIIDPVHCTVLKTIFLD
jgi:hypothetical protein